MGNHIVTKPKTTCKMYLTRDGKYVITELKIIEKRPVSYYTKKLMPKQLARIFKMKK